MSKGTINFKTACPKCGTKLTIDNVKKEDVLPAPKLRSGHKPAGELLLYRETTESIKQFLIDKCRAYAPDISVEILTRYNEKKHGKSFDPHRCYAYFILAMTANEALTAESDDMYVRIGSEGNDNLSFISEIKYHIINKYRWDKKWLSDTLKSYAAMEKLEAALGLTPAMLSEINKFSNPTIIKSNNIAWVEVAIQAEKVLADMFTDTSTNESIPFKINDIRPISENNIQYDILVDPDAKKILTPDDSVMLLIKNSIKNK
jgi:hypothetical protein